MSGNGLTTQQKHILTSILHIIQAFRLDALRVAPGAILPLAVHVFGYPTDTDNQKVWQDLRTLQDQGYLSIQLSNDELWVFRVLRMPEEQHEHQ